jgi:rhodanese-related sulfurtransferase
MRSRFVPEAVAFVILAVVAAAVSNALAGPERKLRWVGTYAAPGGPRPGPPAGAAVTPASPASAPEPAAGPGKDFAPHPQKAWVEISGDDAAELFARKTVPFLDARRTSVYAQGHIAGARPFSVWEADVDDKVKAFFAEGLNQSAPVVVYCSGGDCEDSHMLSEKLYFVGFDNVLVYKDGFPDWQKRGLPTATGPKP